MVTLGDDGVLTVSGNGAMEDYGVINGDSALPWRRSAHLKYANAPSIVSIHIEEGVTYIEKFVLSVKSSTLRSITVAAGNAHYMSEDGILFNKDKSTLILYPRDRQQDAYTIPNSVTNIGEFAFTSSWRLTSITIPNSVTNIGIAAFYSCWRLTSVTIPNGVTTIEDWTFANCHDLTTVTIPNSVTYIGDLAFYTSRRLTSVTIPNSVTGIGELAFGYCDSLTTATVPNSVTYIGKQAFYQSGLTSVTIPGSVKMIEAETFEGCDSLTSVTIENGVKTIGEKAFYQCFSLPSITIPKSVTHIEEGAFESCVELSSVTVMSHKPPKLGAFVFSNTSVRDSLYVPARSVLAYRAADGWKEYNIGFFVTMYDMIILGILSALLLLAAVFVIIKILQKLKKKNA